MQKVGAQKRISAAIPRRTNGNGWTAVCRKKKEQAAERNIGKTLLVPIDLYDCLCRQGDDVEH